MFKKGIDSGAIFGFFLIPMIFIQHAQQEAVEHYVTHFIKLKNSSILTDKVWN